MIHHICSTCLGEYRARAGYFESKQSRSRLLSLTLVPYKNDAKDVFCCRCGALSFAAATYEQAPGDWPCDGIHEDPTEDDLA